MSEKTMIVYLVSLSSESTHERFCKIGYTEKSLPERFSYGEKKVIDSDLPDKEKVTKMWHGEKYISDFPYTYEKISIIDLGRAASLGLKEIGPYLEGLLLKKAQSEHKYAPKCKFSGSTECFLYDEGLIENLVGIMEPLDKILSDIRRLGKMKLEKFKQSQSRLSGTVEWDKVLRAGKR